MSSGAPLTFADQELHMVRVVLQARGWLVTDATNRDGRLTIIATRTAPLEAPSAEQFARNR